MNYFFGYETKLAQGIDWFFNVNHLMLILFIAGFIVLCSFLFSAKSDKGKRITKLALAAVLIVLEVGRTIYKYKMHVYNGGTAKDFNWWWNISFQMCAIMCWTTIVTLILSAFLKKDNKLLQFLYNILFGCALVGGVLTFAYPDCLTEDRAFLHFVNIQTVIVHALLIFVPIYLIKIKEFKVEIKNIWKTLAGYVAVGCIAMSASLISGNNFAFSLKFDMIDLGLPFPWHLPVVMLVLFGIDVVLYGSFEIVRLIKKKMNKQQTLEEKVVKTKPEYYSRLGLVTQIVSNVSAILFGALIMLGTASLIGNTKAKLGVLCLLGLVYMILLLVFAEKHKKYINQKFDNNKAKHITFIVLTMIFALPVGILYLVRFLREKNEFSRLVDGQQ